MQSWDSEHAEQDAVIKALHDSKAFTDTFVKAGQGEEQPDIRMKDQMHVEVKLRNGQGDADVQNKVSMV